MRELLSRLPGGRALAALLLMLLVGSAAKSEAGTIVTINTNFGLIQVDLFDDVAPQTVDNFLDLVTDGRYSNTIVHRSVSNFVIQGGGFNTSFNQIQNNGNIPLEYGIKNTRGTIAMARSSLPNSANSQWFINTANNTTTLAPRPDNPNTPGNEHSDGYAAFGWVITGMDVVDAIAALPKYNFGDPFSELPLKNYTSGTPNTTHQVIINSVTVNAADAHPEFKNRILTADVTNDGRVNSADAIALINDLIAAGGAHNASSDYISDTYLYFDPTGDGRVNSQDALHVINTLLLTQANPQVSPLAAVADPMISVPEPSSLALLAVAVAALGGLAWRRRRTAV